MPVQQRPRPGDEDPRQRKACCKNAGPFRLWHWQCVKHRHVLRGKRPAKVQGTFLLDPSLIAQKRDQMVAQKPGAGGCGHIVPPSRSHMQKTKHAQEFFGEKGELWPRIRSFDGLQRCQAVVRIVQGDNAFGRAALEKSRALQIEIHPVPVRCHCIRQAALALRKTAEKDKRGQLTQGRAPDGDKRRLISRLCDGDQIDVGKGVRCPRCMTARQVKSKTARVAHKGLSDPDKVGQFIHRARIGPDRPAHNRRAIIAKTAACCRDRPD